MSDRDTKRVTLRNTRFGAFFVGINSDYVQTYLDREMLGFEDDRRRNRSHCTVPKRVCSRKRHCLHTEELKRDDQHLSSDLERSDALPEHYRNVRSVTDMPRPIDIDHAADIPAMLNGCCTIDEKKSRSREYAQLWIIAKGILSPKCERRDALSGIRTDKVSDTEVASVLVDGYLVILNESLGRRLSLLQRLFDLHVGTFIPTEIADHCCYLVLLSFHPREEEPLSEIANQNHREQNTLRDALQWLARHVLMMRAFVSSDTRLRRLPDCGVYPCRACDAKKYSDQSVFERFHLASIIHSLPSKLQRLRKRKAAEERRLEEIYSRLKPRPHSLQILPREILTQIFQHTDSRAVWSLSQASALFCSLTGPLVPELCVSLFEHQQAALQWMLFRERHLASAENTAQLLPSWANPLISRVTENIHYDWMHNRIIARHDRCYDVRGGLFCDEPGLGKTLTALALITRTRATSPAYPLHTARIEHFGATEADLIAFICRLFHRFLAEIERKIRSKAKRHWSEFADVIIAARSRIKDCVDFGTDAMRGPVSIDAREHLHFMTQWMQDYSGILSEIIGSTEFGVARDAFRELAENQNPFSFAYSGTSFHQRDALWMAESSTRFFVVSKRFLHGPGGFIRLASDGIPAASAAASRLLDVTLKVSQRSAVENNDFHAQNTTLSSKDDEMSISDSSPLEACQALEHPSTLRLRRHHDRICAHLGSIFDYHIVVCLSATLVASPENLIPHWIGQAQRHLREPKMLRCCLFEEIQKMPFRDLQNVDVVFISFNELRGEYVLLMEGRSLLSHIYWLRFVIDEGHSLGSLSCTNLQRCCLMIPAERRWIMTGTPTPSQTGSATELQYLYPLFSFLGLEPFVWARRQAFVQCIQRPIERTLGYEGLHNLKATLDRVMIRSAKEDISCIPRLEIHDEILSFTTEEADAYNALVSVVKRNLLLADFFDENHRESLLNPANRKSARHALQNLRLCCCVTGHIHFQVIREELAELLHALRVSLEVGLSVATIATAEMRTESESGRNGNTVRFGNLNGEFASQENGSANQLSLSTCLSSDCSFAWKRQRFDAGGQDLARDWSTRSTPKPTAPNKHTASPTRLMLTNGLLSSPVSPASASEATKPKPTVSTALFDGISDPSILEDDMERESDQSNARCGHLISSNGDLPTVLVRDDRGIPVYQPNNVESRLRDVERVLTDHTFAKESACAYCGRLGTQMPVITPCAHVLCLDCAASSRESCRVCGRKYKLGRRNEPVDLIEIQPSFTQDSWVPRWDRKMTSKIARMLALLREWSTDKRSSEPWRTFDSTHEEQAMGAGHGGEIHHKVIIYSNFSHHFDVIYHHLTELDFQFAFYCSRLSPTERRAQIDRFTHDEETWILLMDEKGALGLDLSFVTRIIIMDPVWNRSQERQIISRAHRIGAQRSVVVHRLIMCDSIEADLVDANALEVQHASNSAEMLRVSYSRGMKSDDLHSYFQVSNFRSRAAASNKEQEDKLRRNQLLCRLHFVRGEPVAPGTVARSRMCVP